jgi:methylated-DNA-[protein]-cysteine S-methyltransferase
MDFSSNVWKLTKQIPRGRVTTYSEIAGALGSSPRAVGQALKRNPDAPRTPCHRVIRSDGALGGYGGASLEGAKRKAALLRSEGVAVRDGRVDLERFFYSL